MTRVRRKQSSMLNPSKRRIVYVALFALAVVTGVIAAAILSPYFSSEFSSGRGQTQGFEQDGETASSGTSGSSGESASSGKSDREPLSLRIDGEVVTAGEFRYALNEVRSLVVDSCARGVDSVGAEFWRENKADCLPESSAPARSGAERAGAELSKSYSAQSRELCQVAIHPADFAVCKAIRLLEQQHAAYHQAVAGGQMYTARWAEVTQRLHEKNAVNEWSLDSGSPVYGPGQYDLPVYLAKFISQLRDAYITSDNSPGMTVTETQIREHYSANTWDFGPKVDLIKTEDERWKLISASVKADLRTRIYYDLLASRVQRMEITANRDSLVDFVQATFGN